MNDALRRLASGEVHLYYAEIDLKAAAGRVASWLRVLGDEERARYERFAFDRDRLPFLIARALLRCALSRYASVPPRDWSFVAERHGKPTLRGPEGAPPLTFNISNTAGLAACIVALDRTVGIDAENLERSPGVLDIAQRCLAPSENAQLASIGPERRLRRFFEYWTLKEAYLKARGTGLSVAPRLVAFELEPRRPIRLVLDPRAGDVADRWLFVQLEPSPSHVLAAAIERTGGSDPRVCLADSAFLLAAHANAPADRD